MHFMSVKRLIKCAGFVIYLCFKEIVLTAVKGDA